MIDPPIDTLASDANAGSIAIVGLAGHFPGARSAAELWRLLAAAREATQWPGDEELRSAGVAEEDLRDPEYVRASLVLPDMEMFDAQFFGFSPRDAAILDPQHRHFLECAWEALEDAGHVPESFPGAIGVFAGCGMQSYFALNLLTNPELVNSVGRFLLRHTGNDKDFLCSRLSYLLDLKGPSITIQTACSTSLVAVHVAAQSLLAGECDMALAGGVSIELPHGRGYRYAPGEILSPDGHCRAFDEAAAGTLFGSGVGIVALRRLDDALRDGDNIYAVIRGSAVNNDGSQKAGYLAPSVDGQARAAVEALAVAGVEPSSVAYIEAHGTGTPVGDPIEVAALAQAYGAAARGSLAIGSVKTNIGHLDTAAGVASLIKVALALRHGLIPASLNFSQPNSRLELHKTPFQVAGTARPWPRGAAPRRAAVNSLGVGGTNAHVIVEEPPPQSASDTAGDAGWQVFTLSARSAAALERLKARWLEFLDEPPGFALADAAYTTQTGRKAFDHRCAIVARDVASLRDALRAASHANRASGKASAEAPAVAMMFPGGGAQYPGAGRELLAHADFARAVQACFDAMPAGVPADLRRVMFECEPSDSAAAALLEKPTYALPALFTLEYGLAKLWESWGIRAAAVIGHSAGEYAAACLAGVMSLADALAIVALRGELFEAAPAGSMLSIDLPEPRLRELMAGLELDIAAINGPDLCIASGRASAIAQLEERLRGQELEGRRLRINVAAHSRLLDPVLGRFHDRVARIRLRPPTIPYVSTLTGTWADAQQLTDPDYWVRHLREPVRFAQGLRQLLDQQSTLLLETGPGQGLCALARLNGAGPPRTALASTGKAQDPHGDLVTLLASAGAMWSQGCALNWAAMRGAARPRRISIPTYAFERERHWIAPGLQAPGVPAQLAQTRPAPVLARLPSYDDWFRIPEWIAAPLPADAARASGHWLMLGHGSSLTADIATQATSEGAKVTLVRRDGQFAQLGDGSFTLDAGQQGHFSQLLAALERDGGLPDHIVHLWGLDTVPVSPPGQLAGQDLAFDSLIALAKALQEADLRDPIRLTVVSAGSQAVAGEAVPHPERALALGPCRVLPHEMPSVRTRFVDLPSFDLSSVAMSRAIVREAAHPGEGDLVAWRGGERWVWRLDPAASVPEDVPGRIRERGVYLITGGLGDIALELAGYLARHRARLALVSRRAMPGKPSWRGLAASGDCSLQARLVRRLVALEDQGAEILTFSADVADRDAMARVVGDCRARFGVLNGVFHTAGVLEDAPIAVKRADSVHRVLAPKAYGAQVLHELLPPGDLDLFATFSSTSLYLGAPGQADYVAANAFLDAVAASRPDGLSIHWGVWGDTGMAARAYGQIPTDAAGALHPLLGIQVASEDGAAFEATYDSASLWVLQEHRLAGRPLLPGTAYIEIARAAMAALHPGAAIELNALSFEEAMVFEEGSKRLVRVELRRQGERYDFLVRSRAGAEAAWQDHARAGVALFAGSLPSAPALPAGPWLAGAIPQDALVGFGPRWHNIARMRLAGSSAQAELELPATFAGDLDVHTCHAALADMASTFALHLLDAAERIGTLFVPMSIQRVRLVAPMTRTLASRAELTGSGGNRVVAFNVALHASDGSPIATFEGFSLRGIEPGAIGQRDRPQREPALAQAMLACGIRRADAPGLFERIFASASRDIAVSSIAIEQLQQALRRSLPQPAPPRQSAPIEADEAALNPVERAIAEVWSELLGAAQVRPGDDFFALGGHSLAAIRLFARIRKQFAVDLPLATLFETPTLGALAALVAQKAGIATVAAAPAEPRKGGSNVIPLGTRAWSPLVAICRGEAGRKPLFCVHGAGGNVLNFKIISDRLGLAQPFYGLQAQGVDGRMPALTSIEAMAAQYVEAIRTVDARGPYRLAGYSAGGVIALEIAQQLKRDGAQVELLAMIDTLSPGAARRKVSRWKKLWLMRRWSLGFAMDWPSRRRRGKLMNERYAMALEKLSRGEPLPPELVEFHLFRNFVAAQDRYQPERYQGDVLLFKASEADTQYLGAGDALGWEEHIAGQVRVTGVPGSHFSLMAEPGLSTLIRVLQHELGLDAQGPDSFTPPHPGEPPAATPKRRLPLGTWFSSVLGPP